MKSTSSKKILFVTDETGNFIDDDLAILRKHYDVRLVVISLSRKKIKESISFLYHLITGVLWSNLVFIWFGGDHAYLTIKLCKLFNKKTMAVTPGYEVACIPEIGYGEMRGSKSENKVKYVLDNVDKLLAVSEFNKSEILKYKMSSRNVNLIYHGIDYNKYRPNGNKENLVISVGNINSIYTKRKGYKTFIKAAEYLPNTKFVLIGKFMDDTIDHLRSIAPSNVEFTGYIKEEELIRYYQRAKIYCQLSIHEGFGVALAEAMACGCVPVVTNNAALPEVVGDTGFYASYGDDRSTVAAIEEALRSDKEGEARRRVIEHFGMERREKILVDTIDNLA